ncbi:Glutathione S-transferase U17 [Capsicum chinense]|nr:Glutathione S-transferase U17 [Capsicum chinense]
MAGNDVKLLGSWPSTFVMRPRIALNIKSVGYDFLEEQLSSKSDVLLRSNPVYKKIPVLIHDGNPICESLIIVQFWASYIDDKWFPLLRVLAVAQGDDAIKAALEPLVKGLVLLEEVFKNCSKGKFFGGEKIGYLDIALGCFLGWMRVPEKMNNVKLLDEAKTPGLHKWAGDFCADSVVKDVMHETDKLAEAAKVLLPKIRANASS